MAVRGIFALADDNTGVVLTPSTPGAGSASPSLPAGLTGTTISSTSVSPSASAYPRLTQSLIDSVLDSYSEQLSDSTSDYTKFFLALSSAATESELEVFGRVYVELGRGDYSVGDYIVYKNKMNSEISLPSIDAFSRDFRAAKVAGMREKIYNGVFPYYGSLHGHIFQSFFNDPNNEALLRKAEETDPVFSQNGSLLLKPRVSYYGGDSYSGYPEAVDDYWSIVESYFTGTVISSVTSRTATIEAGSRSIPSISPNTTGMVSLQKLYKVSGDGEFGYNSAVRIKSSTGVQSSKKHIASGSITFKSGLPATYQTKLSKSIIDAVFNRHSGDRPYSEPALMADPARKPSYTSDRSLNLAIDSIARASFEKLSRDDVLEEFSLMIEDLVDYFDVTEDGSYEDPLALPNIYIFVEGKLTELETKSTASYDLESLRRLKFYKYVMAPFVGITSGAAFTKETSISSEFSALRSAIVGAREQLISSGKFDQVG